MLHPLALKCRQGFLKFNMGTHSGNMPLPKGYDNNVEGNIFLDHLW